MSVVTGRHAEQAAAAFLQDNGLHIVARNYRCRRGEIDLIAEDGRILVFVEVRRRPLLADAAESIDKRKQARLTVAAAHYLSRGNPRTRNRPCRFDVILINSQNTIKWLKSAFPAVQYGIRP